MSTLDLERLRALCGSLADALERQHQLGQSTVPLAGAEACAEAVERLVEATAPQESPARHSQGAAEQGAPRGARAAPAQPPVATAGPPPWSRSRRSVAESALRARDPERVQTALARIAESAAACTACGLSEGRVGCVRSWAMKPTKLLVLGLPGSSVGARFGGWLQEEEGALLEKMLAAMSLAVPDVHTATMVRCIQPHQAEGLKEAWAACQTWVEQELAWTRAPWVLVVGEDAARVLADGLQMGLPPQGSLAAWKDRRWVWIRHPAELIATPEYKREAWGAMQRLMRAMRETQEIG